MMKRYSPATLSPSGTLNPFQNRLLSLPQTYARNGLFTRLSLVELSKKTVLYQPNSKMNYVYFPINSVITILSEMENGDSTEISVIGNDGMVGIEIVLGAESTPNYAIVQSAGFAYQLSRIGLIAEIVRNNELRNLLLRYAHSFMTQIAQTAVCNRHHSIDQRLCRLLLQSLDRLDSNSLVLTQELIAKMLGVRREGITESAGKLQKLGVISYSRGSIVLLDRDKLESLCCECYNVVKKEDNWTAQGFLNS